MSDDETVAFKSYLLSLGIDDPVTRETHGSGQSYYRELAKEVCRVLDAPVKVRVVEVTLTRIQGIMGTQNTGCPIF